VSNYADDWLGDKGYAGNNMIMFVKRTEGGVLLDWQKEFNKQVNKICYIIIEYVIATSRPAGSCALTTANSWQHSRTHLSCSRPGLCVTA
jgi:hypothetical protein